jgi:hypothetical protein
MTVLPSSVSTCGARARRRQSSSSVVLSRIFSMIPFRWSHVRPAGYREVPMLLIGEGTAEIQKMIVGRRLLEEYRTDS